ncbi:MAG: nucleotidyltransferase family protein [Bacteroidia bacterium]|nr:nucleotidyltransferase family protein [Bacteroidia bacterium]
MSDQSRRAVILAGGRGTRLRPYTVVLPKPLMPIGDYPVLEVIIRQLAHYGFGHITLAVNHQADIIKAYFGDGSKWGLRIDYSLEDKPLSTMAPLRLIPGLPEHFLVMNGDVLTDLDFGAFYETHVRNDEIFTVSSHIREQVNLYGVLETNSEGYLSGFREKPKVIFEVSMGVYMVSRRAMEFIPHGEPYGFDHLMLDLMAAGKPARVQPYQGYWLDIGRPDDYMQAIEEFDKQQDRFLK